MHQGLFCHLFCYVFVFAENVVTELVIEGVLSELVHDDDMVLMSETN